MLHVLVLPVIIELRTQLGERVPVVQGAGLDNDNLRVLGRLRRQRRPAVAAELATQLRAGVRVVQEKLRRAGGEVQRSLWHGDVRGEGGAATPLAVDAVAEDDLWSVIWMLTPTGQEM